MSNNRLAADTKAVGRNSEERIARAAPNGRLRHQLIRPTTSRRDMGKLTMARLEEVNRSRVKRVRDLAADLGGTLPGSGKPNFGYGVLMLADATRALCCQIAQEERKFGNEGEALQWEIRAAFFSAAFRN